MEFNQKIHLQVLQKFNNLKGTIHTNYIKSFLNLPADEFVDIDHHLMSKVRGVYVPKGYNFAYSIKIKIDDRIYNNEVKDMDTFTLIKYYLPNKANDVHIERDTESLKNNYEYNIPVGVVLHRKIKSSSNEYSVLGLGKIIEFSKEFIILKVDNVENAQIHLLNETEDLLEVEKYYPVKVRLKQAQFRKKLLIYQNECAICGCSVRDILIASHIKPWSVSNNIEKLDINNGLLLCPTHDSLFDKGLITFDNNGKIKINHNIDSDNQVLLNIDRYIILNLNKEQSKYMNYHRKHVFIKPLSTLEK